GHTATFGHVNVEQAQIGSLAYGRVGGLRTSRGFRADLEPALFEVATQREPDQSVIICDEDPQRPPRSLHGPSVVADESGCKQLPAQVPERQGCTGSRLAGLCGRVYAC